MKSAPKRAMSRAENELEFNLQPFLEAETAVQVHVIAALLALVTGVVIFMKTKGTKLHKFIGRFWMGAMVITALSSFFIHGLRTVGPFSPLHLLSVWTIGCLIFSIWIVRKGNVPAHKFTLIGLYTGGLVVAGLLTLSRGLLMHKIFIGEGNGFFIPTAAELPGGPAAFGIGSAIAVLLFVIVWASRERAASVAAIK